MSSQAPGKIKLEGNSKVKSYQYQKNQLLKPANNDFLNSILIIDLIIIINCLETNERNRKYEQGNKSHKENNQIEIIELKIIITERIKKNR